MELNKISHNDPQSAIMTHNEQEPPQMNQNQP